jgi:hypothetical protein
MADYHSLLMRAVANLPNAGTPASRGAIYERARKALLEQLRSLRPPLPESDITREETALDAAIAEIEERYGPQEPPLAYPDEPAPTLNPSPVGRPGAAPARAAPAPPPPRYASVQRPSAPTAPGPAPVARSPSQAGALVQPGGASPPAPNAAQRPSPPMQGGNPPAGSPPQAPTPVAGRPAAATTPTVASPARSQLAAAMANQPSAFASRTGRAAPSVGAQGGKDDGIPGVAALDPGRAVRPNKTDDAQASGAPPVVANRSDQALQSAEAPEVAAEFDRPVFASRPEAETQRPVAPGAEVAKPKRLLWVAAAVILGIVLAVAGAAILMRQKPQDLAIKPAAEAQQPAQPEASAKIAERVQSNAPASAASPPPSTTPETGQSSAQAPAAPAPEAAPSAPAAPAPSAGRAAMLVASADNPQKPAVSLGSTVWSLIPPAPNQPSTVGVKAEADIPDLKMHATMTLRKNTDPTLQATHTIDLKFSFAPGAPITGFKDVGLPQMRKEDSTAAEALTSVKVKISETYFLIALAKGEADIARNLDLMQTRSWFDFPLLLNDERIAKVVFQKSAEGQAMLEKAFEAWK